VTRADIFGASQIH